MTTEQAMAFVREHGVVLASANGPAPKVTEAVAKERIHGSWWGHPKGQEIFKILGYLSESSDVLVCRLIEGKVTFVHRRLWPALVRVARHFPAHQIAQIHEEHTATGRHVTHEVAFPKWVPSDVMSLAAELDEGDAFRALGSWAVPVREGRRQAARKKGSRD